MEQGGSIAMAVLNAQYKHPTGAPYSEGLRRLIDIALTVDPKARPDIHQVSRLAFPFRCLLLIGIFTQLIEATDRAIQTLN
jgi:hypothetical protein